MCVPRPRRPMCHRASAGPGACMVPLERRRSVMKPLRACNRYNCDTLAFVVSSGLRGVKEWKRGDISLKLTPANSPAPPPRRRLYLNALHPLWFPVGLEFRDVPSLVGGDDLPPQSIASASSPFRSTFTVIWLKYIVNSFPPPRTSTELVYWYTRVSRHSPSRRTEPAPSAASPGVAPTRLTGRARRPGSPSCTAHAAPDVSCRSAARRDVEGPRSFDRLPHGRTDWRQPIACRCGR